MVARDLYRLGYSRVQGGRTSRRRIGWYGLDAAFHRVFFFLPNPIRLLILKDLRTFRRDPAQWSQFLIFFGLLAFYFVNIRRLSYDVQKPYWRNLISFLNLSVTALILSTFTSRFIFPLLSLEGRNFWVLGLLPLRRESILWGKFAFSAGISLVATEILVLLSDLMLRMGPAMILLHMGMVAILCLGLSGISVGLGARLPNLKEDDPSKIAAGFGGTLNLLVSLVFICAIVTALAVPCHLYFAGQDNPDFAGSPLSRDAVPVLADRRDPDQPGRRRGRHHPPAPDRDQGVPEDGALIAVPERSRRWAIRRASTNAPRPNATPPTSAKPSAQPASRLTNGIIWPSSLIAARATPAARTARSRPPAVPAQRYAKPKKIPKWTTLSRLGIPSGPRPVSVPRIIDRGNQQSPRIRAVQDQARKRRADIGRGPGEARSGSGPTLRPGPILITEIGRRDEASTSGPIRPGPADRLEEADRHGAAEVEAPGLGADRDPDGPVGPSFEPGRGQAPALGPEDQAIAGRYGASV